MDLLAQYKQLNTREASILELGGFRPTDAPEASRFGLNPFGCPDEGWPEHGGRPFLFVCQLNLLQAPYVPELLRDIALVTFFIDPDAEDLGQENNQGWVLRSYSSMPGLKPLTPPSDGLFVSKPAEGRWRVVKDQPIYDDSELVVPEGFNNDAIHLDNVMGTKIGGYPSNIQSEQWWGYQDHPAQPRFVLQIDSEEKVGLNWGDSGCIYLARGSSSGYENKWYLDWQCY